LGKNRAKCEQSARVSLASLRILEDNFAYTAPLSAQDPMSTAHRDEEIAKNRDKTFKDILKFAVLLLACEPIWGVAELLLKRIG